MEEKVEGHPIQGTHYILMPYTVQEEEINLMDLWPILVRWKMVVLFIAVVVLMGSVGYAMVTRLSSTPLFKIQAVLVPPRASQVENFAAASSAADAALLPLRKSQAGDLAAKATPNAIFSAYIKNLQAYKQDASQESSINIVITPAVSSDHHPMATVSVEGANSNTLAKSFNEFIKMVDKKTVHQLVQNADSELKTEKQKLTNKIEYQRKLDFMRRVSTAAALEDAMVIARKLGINNFKKVAPLYMRGVAALKAQLSLLHLRKDVDAYDPNLLLWKNDLAELKKIHFDESHVSAVRLEHPPTVSSVPLKSRHIIVKGLIGGLILGVFAAFLFEFVTHKRRTEQKLA